MDNSWQHRGGRACPIDSHPREWSPPAGLLALGWALTGAAALWWWSATTATDQLFVGAVVLVLACTCVCGTIVRPRLRADRDGVAVRRIRGAQRWPWSQVEFQVKPGHRLGRTVSVLELEVPEGRGYGGGLVVLTKLDLGQDPEEVAAALDSLRRPQ